MIHWAIGELLPVDHPMAFVSAIEALEAYGAVIDVERATVTIIGQRPEWADAVIERWAGMLAYAHQPYLPQIWRIYICSQCCFPELRRAVSRRRSCISCASEGDCISQLPIPWATPPARPPRRKRVKPQ